MRHDHRHAILALAAILSLLTLSCSDESDPVTPVASNLDTARAVTETIGAGGGSIEATDVSGAVYRLDVPAGALAANTSITITPFKTADTGNDMTPLGPGIQLKPEGLILVQPATIQVTLSQTPTGDVPLLIHRTGNQPGELLIAEVDGAQLTAQLHHFSEIIPADGTVPQLIEHWNNLMLIFEADGPSSDIAQQLAYTFLTSSNVEGIPFEEWEADLNGVLAALIVKAVDNCNAGGCILGNNQLNTVISLATSTGNTSLVESAQTQKPVCDTSALDVSIGFAETIGPGEPNSLTVSVTQNGIAVEGATVSISVTGGSAASNNGTTDAGGGFATTVEWNGSSPSVQVNVTATHPGCANPGAASDSATPEGGAGGVVVTSRDSEINIITSASFNLNPGGINKSVVVVYDKWAFKEFSELSGVFDSDTTRAGEGEGGGMTMSGSATASQVSSVNATGGNSAVISFEGGVSGDTSLNNPPGGEAQWQSFSSSISEMGVSIRVFSPSVQFQLSGTIDNFTNLSFTGEGVSICYEEGMACGLANLGSDQLLAGINESGVLIGDPDGGNSYHFDIQINHQVVFDELTDPSSGTASFSGMANVTLTIGP